nr:MAG TPA: hypothetical protein [Caudoviricetes sp.]DAV35329.1 MAG TPA: hypothetical protein [Caudoviricetes sp.]
MNGSNLSSKSRFCRNVIFFTVSPLFHFFCNIIITQ